MEKTAKGYRLSSGREFYANGLIGISYSHGRWCIGQGLDSELYGATGDGDPTVDLDPGERPENWTLEERRELADFMIAQWTAFKGSLRNA